MYLKNRIMAKNKKVYWTTQQGERIEINDLTDSHLTNILLWLQRKNNLPGMRITYRRKLDLKQLKTMLTESKFIYCPRHEQVNKMLQETFEKHHGDMDDVYYDLDTYYYNDIMTPYDYD